jgi:hypothetical protein
MMITLVKKVDCGHGGTESRQLPERRTLVSFNGKRGLPNSFATYSEAEQTSVDGVHRQPNTKHSVLCVIGRVIPARAKRRITVRYRAGHPRPGKTYNCVSNVIRRVIPAGKQAVRPQKPLINSFYKGLIMCF